MANVASVLLWIQSEAGAVFGPRLDTHNACNL